MTEAVWITVGGLTVTTAVIKAIGPLLFGGRKLHPRLGRVIPLLPAALLAALVVTETFGGPAGSITIDPRAAGLATAGLALALRAPILVVVLSAAVVTALLRAVS